MICTQLSSRVKGSLWEVRWPRVIAVASPDRAVPRRCSVCMARTLYSHVAFSTQVYKLTPTSLILGGSLALDRYPVQQLTCSRTLPLRKNGREELARIVLCDVTVIYVSQVNQFDFPRKCLSIGVFALVFVARRGISLFQTSRKPLFQLR